MKEPFTKVKTEHVFPMIEGFIQLCGQHKKNPESTPLVLGWFDGALGMLTPERVWAMILPEHPGGEIFLYK